jgi:hypothetical protein
MNDVRQLFQDIKSVFKSEGVDIETPTKETEKVTSTDEKEDTETEVKETTKEKFEDVVLEDGSVAQIEPDVSLGAAMVVAIEDELVPAPDGDWALADGRVVTTEGGVIVAVSEPELEEDEEVPSVTEEVEEVEVMKNKPLTEDQRKEAKKIIESIITEKHFSTKEDYEVILDTNIKLASKVAKLETAFAGLLELTEKLVNEPTTNSVKKQKSGFQKLKKNGKSDLIDKLKSKNIIN